MPNEKIVFPCLQVKQPIGTFYVGVIDALDLISISYADIRRPEVRDIEQYIGTQRDLSEGRVAEIKQYVTTVDACFPTSIIIAVAGDKIDFDETAKTLSIERNEMVA